MSPFLKYAILKISSYFPTPLPRGMTEFHAWADKIITLAGAIADEDSMKYVLASKIIEIRTNVSKAPLNEFVKLLHKAAANQVASSIFHEIRRKQQEAQAAIQPVATPPSGETSGQKS